jgi:hypothetical protein
MYQPGDKEKEEELKNKDPTVLHMEDGSKQIKIYDSQEKIEMKHLDKNQNEAAPGDEGTDIAEIF